ncbi:MAG: hypothetical protein HQL15_05775 [Candidatus Omnitrophica bacterium]|nr:hypothetical protein [Candidatus Omnitrophota bacterium]
MKKWPWLIYGFFITTMAMGALLDLFSSESVLKMYYTILIGFNKFYVILLILNIISILVGLTAPLVVFLYAFDIKSSLKFWKTLFWIRIAIDLVGHHYDLLTIKSSFFQSLPYALACMGVFFIPLIPSYLAHYFYAFRKPSKIA